MSWQVSATSVPKEQIEEQVDKALEANLTAQPFDSWDDDLVAQQAEAKKLLADAAASGEVGDGPFNITAAGHRARNRNEMHNLTITINGY